jgi:C-terminal processing protease CtpA/Prc
MNKNSKSRISHFLFLALFILLSCKNSTSDKVLNANGIWQQIGYGKIVEIQDDTIKVSDISKVSCVSYAKEPILDFGKVKKVNKDTLTIEHGIDNWKFIKLQQLPALCNQKNIAENNDPIANFETFWHTFNEHYSAFNIRNVEWDSTYRKFEPKINAKSSDLELYEVLNEMVSTLNDDHTQVKLPDDLENKFETKVAESKYSKIFEFQLSEDIARNYVDSLHSYNAGMVRWGMIENEIGYIQINAMLMLANYDVPKALSLQDFFPRYWEIAESRKDEIQRQDEVNGANFILDSVLTSLKGAKAYILDIRFNGGGKDGAALAILNHFTSKRTKAFTKKAKTENGFTPKQDLFLHPTEKNFTGEVILLTSHQTASAAEILTLSSIALPNITRIGSNTEGIFSSTLDKQLPNGWKYELSNEVYEDINSKNYEGIGIPAHHTIEYSKNKDNFFEQLINGLDHGDSAIEKALKIYNNESN